MGVINMNSLVYTTDTEGFSKSLTQAKNLFVAKLYADGILTDAQATRYVDSFAIIITKPSLFKRIFKHDKEVMTVIEQFSIPMEEKE